MKKYTKYKDSGVEWIGDIPEGWNVFSLKRIVSENLKYGANESAELDDKLLPRYIRITDFGNNGQLKDNTFKSLPLEKAQNYLLKEGDILFARSGATVGKTFIFQNYKGKACFAGYLIKATFSNKRVNPKFIFYYTKSNIYINWKDSISVKATIQNIGADKYNYLPTVLPPIAEQIQIATYLDKKTKILDSLVEKSKQKIQLLKEKRAAVINQAVTKGLDGSVEMKDSGVEWIGEVPEGWKNVPLRYLGTFQNGISKGSEFFGKGYPFMNYGDVYKNEVTPKIVKGKVESNEIERGKYSVLRGDVFFTRTSESKDDIGVSSTCLEAIENCSFSGFVIRFRFHNNIHLPEFSRYHFQTHWKKVLIESKMNIVTRSSLSQQVLGQVPVLVPSLSEQQEIVNYLNEKTNEIDHLLQKQEERIALLQEYRQSLISEVVTGKICVLEDENMGV